MKTEIDMKPTAVKDGLTFYPIPEFDDITAAFGADASAYFDRRKLPDVPRKYEDTIQELFFKGGKLPELKPWVDHAKATKAIRAWICSFAPSHESKTATAGYALWLWSEMEEPSK